MRQLFIRFWRTETAATAIEYALIAALISVAIVAGASAVGAALRSMYISVDSKVEAAG
jgi:pilus assembly protein Flp/PilA